MTTATAGFKYLVEVSDDDSTFVVLNGVNSLSDPRERAELDTTALGDTAAKRIPGIKDSSISVSGYRGVDDAGQQLILDALLDGSDVYVRVTNTDDDSGIKYQAKVFAFEDSGDVGGLAEFSAEMMSVAAWASHSVAAGSPSDVGSAAYNAEVNVTGTSTSMTDEGMTDTGDSTTFYTTDATKDLWDPAASFTFEDDGAAISAGDIDSIDYALGKVTFTGTKTGPITVTGNYLPKLSIAQGRSYNLSLERGELDRTVFGDTAIDRIVGLVDAGGSVERLDFGLLDLGDTSTIQSELNDGNIKCIEIFPDADSDKRYRVFAMLGSDETGATVEEIVTSTLNFMGAVLGAQDPSVTFGDPRS